MSRPPRRAVLAQLSHPLGDRNPMFCNKENVPLAAGYLRAMARRRGLLDRVSIDILEPWLADQAGDAALVHALAEREVDLLGLSLYPWNYSRSLWIADLLRALRPGLQVVAGGPEVNVVTLEELLAGGRVDFAVPGEGELAFSELLEALLAGGDPARVPGVTARRDGAIVAGPSRAPLRDLDEIPSPFLGGDIDVSHYRQVHLLFERGCIYSCKFCHWWPDRRSKGRFSLGRIEEELRFLRASRVQEVVFLDASINASPDFDELCELLGRVNGDRRLRIKVQVLYDHFTREQLEAMAAGGVTRLEIGLQSADPEVLRRAGRPMEIDVFERKLRMTQGLPLELQIDFMLGLPGDTIASVERSAAFVREAIRGKRVAQISPFLLSVGSATRFRREAVREGIRFQDGPPYRVLGTPGLSYADLRSLRQRMPALLGTSEHPFWDLDRPHYALNLFEPELYDATGGAGPAPAPGLLIDAIHIDCPGGPTGHKHGFDPGAFGHRLAEVVQLRLRLAAPESCERHLEDWLFRLSEGNPFTVWDVVLEAPGPFDPGGFERALRALQWQVNNLDWDNHLVNREEGPGHARLALRPIVVVPLDSVVRGWAEDAARRLPLVLAFPGGEERELRERFARARALPGEGVLVDVAEAAPPACKLAALQEMTALERRIRAFRDPALKALLEGKTGARVPFRDRVTARAAADGTTRLELLSRRAVRADSAAIALALSRVPRRA